MRLCTTNSGDIMETYLLSETVRTKSRKLKILKQEEFVEFEDLLTYAEENYKLTKRGIKWLEAFFEFKCVQTEDGLSVVNLDIIVINNNGRLQYEA